MSYSSSYLLYARIVAFESKLLHGARSLYALADRNWIDAIEMEIDRKNLIKVNKIFMNKDSVSYTGEFKVRTQRQQN